MTHSIKLRVILSEAERMTVQNVKYSQKLENFKLYIVIFYFDF